MMRRLSIVMGLLWLFVAGCVDFKDIEMVEEFRVLGLSADPPEIAPGEGTVLRALYADPRGNGREVSLTWMGCSGFVHPSEGISTCDMVIPPIVRTAAEGGDTLEIPATPPDLLTGVPPGESLTVTFIVLMCAGGQLPPVEAYVSLRDTADINALCNGGDGLSGFKSVTVSHAEDPNRNPEIHHLSRNGAVLAPADEGGGASLPCAETDNCAVSTELSLYVTPESVQTFETIEFGEPVRKDDTLFVSWFTDGGELSSFRSGESCPTGEAVSETPCRASHVSGPFGPFSVTWSSDEAGTFTVWAVTHDIRGGASWKVYTLQVGSP